jgi:TonB-dependent receptor
MLSSYVNLAFIIRSLDVHMGLTAGIHNGLKLFGGLCVSARCVIQKMNGGCVRKFDSSRLRFFPTVLFFCLWVVGGAFAQSTSGRGSLSGNVKDAAGGALPGAKITLAPGGQTAVTDEQGNFLLSNVPAGACTLKVDAIGFEGFSQSVTVSAGEVARQTAVLKVSSAVEAVQVYAGREKGEVDAMNQQQSADNILEVLPAEVVTSLPNVNIADSVGRLPGVTLERDEGEGKYVQIRGTEPRLSNLTVDGINIPSPEASVRNIKLDTVPAALVGSIQVSKTLLPSMDGDGIGGTVDLITKTAEDRPTYNVSIMGGHTPIISDGASTIDQFTAGIGQRFGATKRFGIFIGATYDYNGRGIDDIEPAPTAMQLNGEAASGANYAVLPTADFREYHYDRRRIGFAGTADYRFAPGSVLFIRGMFSEFQDYGGRWSYTPNINSFDTATTSSDPANNFTAVNSPRNPDYQIGNISTTYTRVFGPWMMNAAVAFSRSRANNENFPSAGFQGPSGMSFSVDQTNPYRPKFNITSYAHPTDNIYDPNQYTLQSISLTNDHSAQVNLQGQFDLSRSYAWHGHMGTWQAGAKLRTAHKFDDVDDTGYSGDGSISMAAVEDSYQTPDYYNGTYDYYTKGHVSNWGKILGQLKSDAGAFSSSGANQYVFNLHELIPAQYLMNTTDVGRFRFVEGLRLEETISDFNFNSISSPSNGLGKQTSTYVDFMPNAQVRYSFDNNTNVRAIYGRGIARPNYGDLVPTFTPNGTSHQINEGNSALLPTRAHNFDILAEHYFKTVGVIQGGFFYKQISNPIVTTFHLATLTVPGYPTQVWKVSQPINLTGGAHIGGLEVAWEEHFKHLPGALSGLGIFSNYGYSFSQAQYSWVYTDPATGNPVATTNTRALPRQAPNTFNLNPTFDWKNLSVRLGVSYNETNIYAYNWQGQPGDTTPTGPKGPTGDNYFYSHMQMDSQVAYTLPMGLKLSASGLDLNNEVFGFYQGSPQYPIQREYYHPTYSFTLSWTSGAEK